jgi:hypothetical protein
VLQAEKDFNLASHPEIEGVPNLHVIKLMQSFKSKELVSERFAWRHYYWCVGLGPLGAHALRRRLLLGARGRVLCEGQLRTWRGARCNREGTDRHGLRTRGRRQAAGGRRQAQARAGVCERKQPRRQQHHMPRRLCA